MIESHPIPDLAVSAAAFANQQHQANLNQLAEQTMKAMGLQGGGWHVDFAARTISREVPDIAPKAEVMSG